MVCEINDVVRELYEVGSGSFTEDESERRLDSLRRGIEAHLMRDVTDVARATTIRARISSCYDLPLAQRVEGLARCIRDLSILTKEEKETLLRTHWQAILREPIDHPEYAQYEAGMLAMFPDSTRVERRAIFTDILQGAQLEKEKRARGAEAPNMHSLRREILVMIKDAESKGLETSEIEDGIDRLIARHIDNPHFTNAFQRMVRLETGRPGSMYGVIAGRASLWTGGKDLTKEGAEQGFAMLELTPLGKLFDDLTITDDWQDTYPIWKLFSAGFARAAASGEDIHLRYLLRVADHGAIGPVIELACASVRAARGLRLEVIPVLGRTSRDAETSTTHHPVLRHLTSSQVLPCNTRELERVFTFIARHVDGLHQGVEALAKLRPRPGKWARFVSAAEATHTGSSATIARQKELRRARLGQEAEALKVVS